MFSAEQRFCFCENAVTIRIHIYFPLAQVRLSIVYKVKNHRNSKSADKANNARGLVF